MSFKSTKIDYLNGSAGDYRTYDESHQSPCQHSKSTAPTQANINPVMVFVPLIAVLVALALLIVVCVR